MLALGLNIVVGFAGLLDLGFVAFYALGAYVVGWFASSHFSKLSFSFGSTATSLTGEAAAGDTHLFLDAPVRGRELSPALCGVIIGAPTLQAARGLPGDSYAWVRGDHPPLLPERRRPRWLQPDQRHDRHKGHRLSGYPLPARVPGRLEAFGTLDLHPWYYTILVIVLITIYVNIRLRDSRLGRAWISVREDETAAAAMGINPVTTKLWAYALGAVFGGIAGAFYGAFIKNIFPDALLVQHLDHRPCAWSSSAAWATSTASSSAPSLLQGLNFYLLPQINEWVHAIGNAVGSPASQPGGYPEVQLLPVRHHPGAHDAAAARGHHPQPPARRGAAQRRRRRRRRRAWGERP